MNYSSRKRFKLFNHEIRTALMIKPWSGMVEGTLALCQDGHYILMADYDNLPLNAIEYELKAMQDKYGFGNAYVFQSSNQKYHAVCFDKFTFNEYDEILKQLRIDPGFRQSKMWLLRISPKKGNGITFVKVLKGNQALRQKSRAHLLLYARIAPEITRHCVGGEWDSASKTMHTEYSS